MAAEVMEHGKSIALLGERYERMQERLVEYAADAWDDEQPMSGTRIVAAGRDLVFVGWEGSEYPLTGSARSTLATQLDLPHSFIDRCMRVGLVEHAAASFQVFLNLKLKHRPDYRLFLRFRGQGDQAMIRAFCSPRYGRFDNVEAMRMIKGALPTHLGEPVALKSYGDADNMRGTLLFPNTAVRVEDDSEYYMGLYYRNSEVCESAFGISPFLFRSYCTNSAIWGRRDAGAPDIKVVHLGEIRLGEVENSLQKGVGLAVENGPNLLKLLGYAKDAPVTNPKAAIGYLAHQNAIPPEAARVWYGGWEQEPAENAAGILNGLTRAAQAYAGEQRIWMETLAGELLAPSILSDKEGVTDRWAHYTRAAAGFQNTQEKKFRRYFPREEEVSRN